MDVRWQASGAGTLKRRTSVPVVKRDQAGFSADALEAQAFAFLAVRTMRGLPITFPTTSGAPRPLTGGVLAKPDLTLRIG